MSEIAFANLSESKWPHSSAQDLGRKKRGNDIFKPIKITIVIEFQTALSENLRESTGHMICGQKSNSIHG